MRIVLQKRGVIALAILLVAVVTTLIYIKVIRSKQYDLKESDKISLVVERDAPGFIEHNSLYYGYMFDIVREYALSIGRDIEITVVKNRESAIAKLISKEADMALMFVADNSIKGYGKIRGFDIYDTDNYLLLSKTKGDKSVRKPYDMIKNKKVLISDGFDETAFFKSYTDIQSVNFIDNDNRFSNKLIKDLLDNKVDMLICAERNAAIYLAKHRNLYNLSVIDSSAISGFYIDKNNVGIYDSFNNWYYDKYLFGMSHIYNEALYKTDLYIDRILRYGYIIPYGALTPLDYTFKKVANEYGLDWEFLAAIGLIESHFNPTAISSKGARGIMQIMPRVYERLFTSDTGLSDIDANVEAAAKLIYDIRKSLKVLKDSLDRDQMAIILACYNGGLSHVKDAINLSKKYGKGVMTWKEISYYLLKKTDEAYYNDPVVTKGRFNASYTVNFVNKVLKQYDSYKNNSATISE